MTGPVKLGPCLTWGLPGELFSLSEMAHEQSTAPATSEMYQQHQVQAEQSEDYDIRGTCHIDTLFLTLGKLQ